MFERLKFYDFLRGKGLKDRTLKDYMYLLNNFKALDFTQQNVDEFLLSAKGNRPSGRAFIRALREFYTRTFPSERYHLIQIIKQTGKKNKKLPVFLTLEEISQVEKAMISEREKLMLYITFYGGLRAKGLMGLTLNSFKFKKWAEDKSQFLFFEVTEKSDKSRIVMIPPFLAVRLMNWILKERKSINFNSPIWKIQYRRWHFFLTEASKKALGKQISPHILRHSCATWMLNNGWTLQKIANYLGHESIVTTQIYAHLDKREVVEDYKKLFK
jgi:integrase/recombinase XerD